MQRVMIIGQPGSGKSTLARIMGERTGLPVFHMDHIHHLPDWHARPAKEKGTMTRAVHAKPRWIFEGNHSSTMGERMERADTVIYLDFPVWLRILRVTKRLFHYYGKERPDMAPGCVEKLHGETLAFYVYIWRTRRRAHRRNLDLLARAGPDKTVVTLRDLAQVDAYLESLPFA